MHHTAWLGGLGIIITLGVGCAAPSDEAPDETLGVSRSALVTVSVEGEAASGGGVIEPDASASNQRLRAFATPGTQATVLFATTGTMQSVSVTARGGGCSPQLQVIVDNTPIGTQNVTATSWTAYAFTPPALAPGSHSIAFRYASGPAGCVLRVDRAVITTADPPPPPPPPPPVSIEAESATGAGTVLGDATASGGQYRSMTVTYQSASRSFTAAAPMNNITLRARRTGCTSTAVAKLAFETGASANLNVTSSAWTTLAVPLTVSAGAHTATFEYRFNPGGCTLDFDVATLSP